MNCQLRKNKSETFDLGKFFLDRNAPLMVLMPIGIHSIKALFALTLTVMVIPPCYGPSSNTPGLSGIVDASGFCNIQVDYVSQKYPSWNQVSTERKKQINK